SKLAKMKASIGLATAAGLFTEGIWGRTGFLNAHQDASDFLPDASSHGAPFAIHSRIADISVADSPCLPGGIFRAPSRSIAFIRRLWSGFPGTMAGPLVPPFSNVSRLRRSRPDIFAAPWQEAH